ncbi:hypothetical protein [Streptomyces sp. NPDC088733]|uniref:hypothetical protein n=1 Tax=Streptomyces sp. NPDC088733 TaxID=3365880 RepID=UPI00381E4462
MRPKIVVFDECQELFLHKLYGKEAAELAEKVIKKARKCGITLVFVTPSPNAGSIPKELTRNTSHNVAFAVGDYIANDGLLGTGKHKAGITATTLIPGEDVGTEVTVGFNAKPFEVIRCHYVARDPEKGIDEVTPVVERAMGVHDGGPAPAEPSFTPADPLVDILTVLENAPRMRTQDVVRGLSDLNPEAYGDWSFGNLRRVLDESGHGEYKMGGRQHVSRQRIVDAIADRDDDGDDEAEFDAS